MSNVDKRIIPDNLIWMPDYTGTHERVYSKTNITLDRVLIYTVTENCWLCIDIKGNWDANEIFVNGTTADHRVAIAQRLSENASNGVRNSILIPVKKGNLIYAKCVSGDITIYKYPILK